MKPVEIYEGVFIGPSKFTDVVNGQWKEVQADLSRFNFVVSFGASVDAGEGQAVTTLNLGNLSKWHSRQQLMHLAYSIESKTYHDERVVLLTDSQPFKTFTLAALIGVLSHSMSVDQAISNLIDKVDARVFTSEIQEMVAVLLRSWWKNDSWLA